MHATFDLLAINMTKLQIKILAMQKKSNHTRLRKHPMQANARSFGYICSVNFIVLAATPH
jgi:hypothetical protein